MQLIKNQIRLMVWGFAFILPAHAFDSFVVQDIRLEGLQRIGIGTVFNYLPVKVGDKLDAELSSQAVRDLYKTGFFKDVHLEREGNVLVVFVAERPTIAKVTFSGNSDIPSEQLEAALQHIELLEGRVFNRFLLEEIEQELRRQYFGLGKYGVKITVEVKPLERNRVEINIQIAEGEVAQIYEVNIVGNQTFSDQILFDELQLAGTTFFGGKKEYSKQQLTGDLETLKSYYQDRGYINFNINSTQVSITPDKEDVYVTINLTEGEKYTVRSVKLEGELILDEKELMGLLTIRRGDVFSRKEVVKNREAVTKRLTEEGYFFANINVIPDLDKDSKTLVLTFFVDPGRRIYVRRINISGNDGTRDEVIRREIRQMEGAWISTSKVSRSRTRLNRLGFFETVNVETPAVQGSSDQVDISYEVKDMPTGSFTAGIGFSDAQGLLLNLGIQESNFAGTGKRVGITVNNSAVTKSYRFSYTNPYYTKDGISRGFSVSYIEVDAAEADITNYVTNTFGASVNYGVPLSEHFRFSTSIGYENTDILINQAETAQQILDFISVYGDSYNDYKLDGFWTYDTRNHAIFPTDGLRTTVSTAIALPGGDLQYYKLGLSHDHYFNLGGDFILKLGGGLGYGDGYGDTKELPPFKNYFAGGSRSVRGYDSSSLGGPNTRDKNDNPIGGDTRVLGSIELVLPSSDDDLTNTVRFSTFIDGGWVYARSDPVDLGELRYSLGAAMIWLTPIGALRFSYAEPLNAKSGDKIQNFQFTLGTAF